MILDGRVKAWSVTSGHINFKFFDDVILRYWLLCTAGENVSLVNVLSGCFFYEW